MTKKLEERKTITNKMGIRPDHPLRRIEVEIKFCTVVDLADSSKWHFVNIG